MPVLIPTPAELEHMPWPARHHARKAAANTLRAYLGLPRTGRPPRTDRNTGVSTVREGRHVDLRPDPIDADRIRAEAAAALAALPPDPDAAQHRAELLAAIA